MLVYQRLKWYGNFEGICPVLNIVWIVWVGRESYIFFTPVEWFLLRWSHAGSVAAVWFPMWKKGDKQKHNPATHIVFVCCVHVFFFMHAQNKRSVFPQNRRGSRWLTPNTKNSSLCQFTPLSYHLTVRPILICSNLRTFTYAEPSKR